MTAADGIQIAHALDRAKLIPTLVEWFIAEWEPWYGAGGDGDAKADLAACSDRDALPVCLVALGPDDSLLGTVALRATSVGSELGFGPWLAGLLVETTQRGQGIGSALVAAIEDEAARLGYDAIYTSTDSAEGLMRQRGWTPVGSAPSLRGDTTVFRCDLSGRAQT